MKTKTKSLDRKHNGRDNPKTAARKPIAAPVIVQSPFVMSSRAEIQQALEDYQFGKMGELVS